MKTSDTEFVGAIPDIYDTHLVPMIFEPYARDLASRVPEGARSLLETFAGSGAVTRALARRLSPGAELVVTDLNQPMLDRARSRQGEDVRITWQAADALDLPFPDGRFDVVLFQFGIMFLPDRVAGLKEALRVLKPGGHVIYNTWDRIEENAFPHAVTEAAAEVFPDDPPRFMARIPHGYHDPAVIEADARTAGLADVRVETVTAESRAASAREVAYTFCKGTPFRADIETRDPARLDEVVDRAERVVEARFGTGPITGKIQAHVVTARAP